MGNFPLTPYFDGLIDDFGIWQHTDGKNILRAEGYALDDATRALLFTLAAGRLKQSEVLFAYLIKSQTKSGLCGFADSKRHFLPTVASDDAIGQVIWAAGYAFSNQFHQTKALKLIKKAKQYLDKTSHVRGFAYGLLGAIYINAEMADYYHNRLLRFFDRVDETWTWPEESLTYGNGIIAYAFLRYGLAYNNKSAVLMGRKILEFLESKCTLNRQRGPIGNEGWLPCDAKNVPKYSQQPIDAAYMIWAWLVAYQVSDDPSDKAKCTAWMQWFKGKNIAGQPVYDLKTMKCFDGINKVGSEHSDAYGINYHSGAESNACWLLSKYIIDKNITI